LSSSKCQAKFQVKCQAAIPGGSRSKTPLGLPLNGAVVLILLDLFALAAPVVSISAAPQDKVAEKLVGAWRLVSVQGDSPMRKVGYDHPTGLIVYDRSGWMSVQIAIHGERKPFAKGVSAGTLEERAEAFDTYLAYYGTYTVDAKAETVTHHLADHSYPASVAGTTFAGSSSRAIIASY
jgi:hypothetical protein